MERISVAHLTSAHPRYDSRIFIKQCRSLAANGYDVSLVVADDRGDEVRDGVTIADVGRKSGRLGRMLVTTGEVYRKALVLDADAYHIHDPELIPVGVRLKHHGKHVIFDAHEDVPKQLLNKPYMGPLRLRALAGAFSIFERFACSRFDGLVAATPFIRDKFEPINARTVDVNNFPVLGELESVVPWGDKANEVCYVGGIAAVRGIREVVAAMDRVKNGVRLNLGGTFNEPALEAEVQGQPGWARVNALGFLDRAGVRGVLGRSLAGLVTLHPIPNYLEALPVKMFEYMAAGIPVIASDFPLWRQIVDGNACGICVNPLDPVAIAKAIDILARDPDLARRMGENGRKAVEGKYNWSREEDKLLRFYREVLA